MFFDTHAHLTSQELYEDLPEILERAQKAQIHRIVNICTDLETLEKGIAVAEKTPWLYNAGATTPHDVEEEGEIAFSAFERAALSGKFVAVGETGLDYFYEHSNRTLQQEFLIRYLDLAKRANLPVVIHCRDAFEDLFAITKKEYSGPLLLHCFTGNLAEAQEAINRGWLISMSGIVTFKKSQELQNVAREIPLSHLVIETDAPYLAPQGHRGKKNEPAFLPATAQFLADLQQVALQEFAQVTSQNAQAFFKIQM